MSGAADRWPAELGFHERLNDGYYNSKLDYKADNDAWNSDQGRLIEEFEKDLFAHYGVTDNPKKDLCYQVAWELGHSAGIHEITSYFADIVVLIK